MINYDKEKIKQALDEDDYFDLLTEFNANPTITNNAIVCDTICHNRPGEGSHKLYLYRNDGKGLCHCYTNGCDEQSFDIFQLIQKVAKIQWNEDYDLNTAVRFVASRFGISGEQEDDKVSVSEDWKIFQKYDKIKEIKVEEQQVIELKEYDKNVLKVLNYNCLIEPWYNDGISVDVMRRADIGFFAGDSQISIPHYDKDGRFVGLRGRTLIIADAEQYGKYRPIRINGVQYNHPLGFNLYGLNWNKDNIRKMRKAIIYESEKSVLQHATKFGWENNISVACCGSNISAYQINLLLECGAEEIVVAMDRDFEEYGDKVCKAQISKYEKLNKKYGKICKMSFIFDKNNIMKIKQSPIESDFLRLFNERIFI